MSETAVKIPMDHFCALDGGFSLPYRINGKLVATDSAIMIRCDESCYDGPCQVAENSAFEIRSINSVKKNLFPNIAKVSEWHKCPDVPPPLPHVERYCDGCRGTGQRECDLGHRHECRFCDGTGRVWQINKHEPTHIMFGTLSIATKYARLIAVLPDVEWGGPVDKYGRVLCFRFTGGEGLIATFETGDA